MATSRKKKKAATAAIAKKPSRTIPPLTLKKRSKLAAQATVKKKTGQVLRFAQPFYTTTPVEDRKTIPGIGKRMTDYLATQLQPIPAPLRDPSMTLAEIIGDAGAAMIQATAALSFHAVGDTGNEKRPARRAVARSAIIRPGGTRAKRRVRPRRSKERCFDEGLSVP